jgi:hypothetical protein
MAAEWWITGSQDNMLKGVEGDESNPLRLEGEAIVEFLMMIPQSRASFDRLLPTMEVAEQARLNELVEGSPSLQPLVTANIDDNFQHRMNTPRLQRGGGWMPPPFQGP